jgi:hypothetical protein
LRVLWYRRVVSFDARQQVELMDSVKQATTSAGDVWRLRLEGWAKRVKTWLAGPWDWARAWRAVAGAALVGAALLGAVRASRWLGMRWHAWRNPGAFDPVRREAGGWLRKITEREVPHAESASVRRDLERVRYGRRETWPDPRAVFRRARRLSRG